LSSAQSARDAEDAVLVFVADSAGVELALPIFFLMVEECEICDTDFPTIWAFSSKRLRFARVFCCRSVRCFFLVVFSCLRVDCSFFQLLDNSGAISWREFFCSLRFCSEIRDNCLNCLPWSNALVFGFMCFQGLSMICCLEKSVLKSHAEADLFSVF